MLDEVLDWVKWNLWQKWAYRWKHRNDTLEEARAELYERWSKVLDEFKDEPATRELHDALDAMDKALDAMDKVKKSFGDK